MPIPFSEAVRVWARVAALSFGGPAGQIAVMHRIVVEEKRWVSEERFLHALNFCMLLPGPEAQQLATYLGWLLHGTRGALVAGGLFILPGFLALLGLSLIYALYHQSAWLGAVFYGLKPAVLAVVVEALLRLGKRALGVRSRLALSVAAFLALAIFDVPFPLLVLGAALLGLLAHRLRLPGWDSEPLAESLEPRPARRFSRTLATALLWLGLWWLPVAAVVLSLGREHVLSDLGLFFSQAAVVTFGGAYAVLAYVAQRAVEDFGWLAPGEMVDGLGLAETTPGPLIMVLQFVGFLAAYRAPAPFSPLVAGVLGATLTTWVTFAPSFLWILVGAPYVERLRRARALSAALSAVTAAVVGVIAHLGLWFALHTLFTEMRKLSWLGREIAIPAWESLDLGALGIAIFTAIVLLRLRWSMFSTLALGIVLGMLLRALAVW